MFQDTAFGWKSLGEDVVSLIVSEVYDALIEAGTSEEKARAAAGAIPVVERLATRDDMAVLKDDMVVLRDDIAAIRNEMVVLRHDLASLKLVVFSSVPALLGLLVKLVFFP